MLNYFNFFF